MYSLDTTFITQKYYHIQKDVYRTGLAYSGAGVLFLQLFRSQICEMRVLQVIPGFYLNLLFTSVFVLGGLSILLRSLCYQVDIRKAGGAKTFNRMKIPILVKLGFFILFTATLIALNSIIPLSFDIFDSYGQDILENLWAFADIISIETAFIFLLIFISQVPVFALLFFDTEKDVMELPEIWKEVVFLCLVISGVLTPTVDVITQLNFTAIAIVLYIMVITIIQKRVSLKFLEINTLG